MTSITSKTYHLMQVDVILSHHDKSVVLSCSKEVVSDRGTRAVLLSLGLPYRGAEVQSLAYVLEHSKKSSKRTSTRDSWVVSPIPDLKMLLTCVRFPKTPTLR